MARYRFVTDARVGTSPARAWELMEDPRAWPSWWRWLRSVERVTPGASDHVGEQHRWRFWTPLPYSVDVTTEVVRSEHASFAELRASGDLVGTGLWELSPVPEGMTVRWTWDVATTRTWMNLLAPVARPAFTWSHQVVMRDWARGLARELDAPLLAARHRVVR